VQGRLLEDRETKISRSGYLSYVVFALAFFVFSTAFLFEVSNFYFGIEGVYFVGRGMKAISDPLSIFRPDFAFRFHPLFFALEAILYRVFGLDPAAQLTTLLIFHLITVWLLFDFVCKLGVSRGASLLGSLFFLFLGSHWTLVFDISQVARLGAALFFLSSLRSFHHFLISKQKSSYVISLLYFLASLGFGEDSVILPAILCFLIVWVKGWNRSSIQQGFLTLPFFMVSLSYVLLSFSAGSAQLWRLGMGPYMAVKMAYFFKDFLHFLIIPRPEFVTWVPFSSSIARLIPALLAGIFISLAFGFTRHNFPENRNAKLNLQFIFFALVWTLIACLPYAARPTGGEWDWHSRYFYFTGMGICMICGILSYGLWLRLQPASRVLKIGFGILLIFIWALNLKTNLFMIHKLNLAKEVGENKETRPFIFSLENQLLALYGTFKAFPEKTVLVIENSPYDLSRVKKILSTYYAFLPERIVVGNKEETQAVPMNPGENRVYLKWEGRMTGEVV
jgi:hypothetical protein